MVGLAAVGALTGAVLNAIGSDPEHLRLSITAIFSLAALLALFPATIGRPKIPPPPPRHRNRACTRHTDHRRADERS
jgi:hypothetical protein